MSLTPQKVVEEFGRLTGIKFLHQILPYDVENQALQLAKHFQLWQLELVVTWTKAKIKEGEEKRNGFSELSLQWHRLIAKEGDDRLTQFQQRLGLAMKWARKFRPSLIPGEEQPAATPSPAREERPVERNVDPGAVSALKRQLMGGSAA